MKIVPFFVLALMAAPAMAATTAPDLDKAAGVYMHQFQNATVDGQTYTSQEVFELVKLSPGTAYFRIHSEFFNGAECNLWGVADLMPDALTYFGPAGLEGQPPCVLKFKATPQGLITEDAGGGCDAQACGARGTLDSGGKAVYKFTARRPIRYMKRLLASTEYKDAVKEHAGHAPGTPAPSH
ncbi:hypothetical protein [Asticcacaulis solisilvae]|uniref:hypothetical protein n=1 Tax=Asticcacaulis solisilvae TaxID=1217274 RepID=UPI003FD80D15